MSLFDISVYEKSKVTGMRQTVKAKPEVARSIAAASRKMVWPNHYFVVTSRKQMERVGELIAKDGMLIFDVETTGLHPWKDRVLCISIWADGKAFVFPFEHHFQSVLATKQDFRETLGRYFNDPNVKLMNHNVKFDCHFVEEDLKIPTGTIFCDTLQLAWLLDPTADHGLKELSSAYGFSDSTGGYTAQFGKNAWSYIEPRLANYYACMDVELVSKLYPKQIALLEKKPKMKSLFWDVEAPTLDICYRLERHGMKIDEDYFFNTLTPMIYKLWREAIEPLRPWIEPHLHLVSKVVTLKKGQKFVETPTVEQALESHAMMAKIFFDGVGTPLIKNVTLLRDKDTHEWTKRTLAKDAIVDLRVEREEMRLLGIYRGVATLKKMFIDALPELMHLGRIHPIVNVIGTDTGRMSMSAPNLQQVPNHTELGMAVRKAFIADFGRILIGMDFAGQEMRLMAHYSRDEKLVKFYRDDNGLDIYSQTAIDVEPDPNFDREGFAKMSKADRKKTKQYANFKALVLGLGFGMKPPKYARQTGVSLKVANANFNGYHATYPGVNTLKDRTIKFAQKTGYITTLLGRERPLPWINSANEKMRAADERYAVNTPIQGSAADQVKKAAVDCQSLIDHFNWPISILLFIHDEIIFDGDEKWVINNPGCIEQLRDTLTSALPLIVPVQSSITYEKRWGEECDPDTLEPDELLQAA